MLGKAEKERKKNKKKKKTKKKIIPMSSYPTRNRKFQKNSKKIQKTKKHHYGISSSQNKLGKAEKERRKKKSFQQVRTWPVVENSKKIVKKFEKLENTIMASFRAKICWGRLRKRKNKKNRSDEFRPNP